MEFALCRAKAGGGGALRVESDFIQHAGSMKFRSCAATEDGGAMNLGKSLTATGAMEFYACHADGDGGAIKLQGDLLQQADGNMSFALCTARRGGAVSAYRLEASSTMEFKVVQLSLRLTSLRKPAVQTLSHAPLETEALWKSAVTLFVTACAALNLAMRNKAAEMKGSALEVLGDFLVPHLPTDCPDGVLDLTGTYVVDWVSTFDGNCKIRGKGAAVLIREPLVVEGAVEFLGLITFIGLSPMEQACVTVHGSITIGGTSDEANILFTDCHNQGNTSAGGALHIAEGLTVVSGVLEIERSSSVKGGAGVYIDNGNLRQAGGMIKIKASTSEGNGGGLLISKGSLVQADGQISCHKCSAKRGGCMALNGVHNYSLQTNGSIEAEGCTAAAGAGSQSF
ncbi:pmpB [Symbiodinium necroappetens]|uniref:PmpB protein n=1 Tax=Symbiodinium necroappetens TaxID=1628268 RepID=A0A812LCN7_9DINO|nr:pmpB [Symbiodinium necroappetens]